MVVGHVAIFRSVPRSFWDGCKTINLCRVQGPWDGGTDRNVGIGARRGLVRTIGRPSLFEVDPTEAFALRPDLGPHVDGNDAEGAQELGDLALGDGFAPVVFRPRSLRIGAELGHEVNGADHVVIAEGRTAVGKQHDAYGLLCTLTREMPDA